MTLNIVTILSWILLWFIVAFIISFPIIAIYYWIKMKKIKKNIPEDLKGGEVEKIKNAIQEKEKKFGRGQGDRGGGGGGIG